jgi:DNA-directed RNA polymerase subunit RPC12/RpoP
MTTRKISLKVVTPTANEIALKAPPVLKESDPSVDYTCGQCGVILLHAVENHVHDILIHCANCGSYNSTES